MAEQIPDGTLVVVAGKLGRTIRSTKHGNAHGYDVSGTVEAGDGYLPHFVEGWMVRPAVVGDNVCGKRRGDCWCGLVHVTHPEDLPSAA